MGVGKWELEFELNRFIT